MCRAVRVRLRIRGLYGVFDVGVGRRKQNFNVRTSFMALGIMFPGFFSGAVQEFLGYAGFFEWVLFCTLVSFFVTYLAYRTLRD